MPIIIKVTSFKKDEYIFVNASSIRCFYPIRREDESHQFHYSCIEFSDRDIKAVKETPDEIAEIIAKACSAR